MIYTQEQIIELAKDVELEDNINWAELPNVDKDRIYQIVGSQALELYSNWTAEPEEQEAILLATIIKLLVENFVLHTQINSI